MCHAGRDGGVLIIVVDGAERRAPLPTGLSIEPLESGPDRREEPQAHGG